MNTNTTIRLRLIAAELPTVFYKNQFTFEVKNGKQLILEGKGNDHLIDPTKHYQDRKPLPVDHYKELRKLWQKGGNIEQREQRIKNYCSYVTEENVVKA